MSKNLRRIQDIMERRLWPVDILLGILLVKLTFFEKPFWCIKKGNKVTVGSLGRLLFRCLRKRLRATLLFQLELWVCIFVLRINHVLLQHKILHYLHFGQESERVFQKRPKNKASYVDNSQSSALAIVLSDPR